MRVGTLSIGCLFIASIAMTSHAAFIVEAGVDGKASSNFTSGGHSTTTVGSSALGTSVNSSAYGNPGDPPDIYTFSYTPGTDADNTVLSAGEVLGTHRLEAPLTLIEEEQLASGLTGGESGLYNVYITWPLSGNISGGGSTVTIHGDDAPIVLEGVDQNGDPELPTVTDIGEAGANKWLKIGTVPLTSGNTYTVTMEAANATFVSQRVHGVMWEPAANVIPEPASFLLFALGFVGLAIAGRRRDM